MDFVLNDCQATLPHRFTTANAREMAAKANAAKAARKAALEAEAKIGRASTPQTERLAKQIGDIEDLMDGEKDADTLQKLSMAHSRLFAAWQVLTGTPNPGSRKTRSTVPGRAIPVAQDAWQVTTPVTTQPAETPKPQ